MSTPLSSASTINVVTAFQAYITKILALQPLSGMKALIMDEESTRMVGMACSLSEVISKEVFVIERINAQPTGENVKRKAAMAHLKAVIILRPVKESVDALCKILKAPRFKEFHLFFTNTLSDDLLKQIAEADAEHDLVRQVNEYYFDYYALTSHLFTANRPSIVSLYHARQYWQTSDRQVWQRNLDAVVSMILTQKVMPTIRYTRASDLTKAFASDLSKRIRDGEGLFQFPTRREEALLLIMDRRDDPVTPLLQMWTYQAMVHEQLGIKDNTVDMSATPKVRPDQRQIVIAAHQDKFFNDSMHLNYGEIDGAVKSLISDYQKTVNSNSKLDTLDDMQKFVDKYPEFKQQSGNVSKHMALLGEVSRLVNLYNLMDVSELEQELACASNHSSALGQLLKLLELPNVRFRNKLNLVMLYALRYETERQQILQLKEILKAKASNDKERARIRAVDEVLRVAGSAVRGSDIFNNKTVLGKMSTFIGSSVRGIENVFARHRPLLAEVLDAASKGKLKTKDYPTLDNDTGSQPQPKPDVVYVFVLGGTTYEESFTVHQINTNARDYANMKVLLGGSTVHNSKSYIDDLLQEVEDVPEGAVAVRVGSGGSEDEYKRPDLR